MGRSVCTKAEAVTIKRLAAVIGGVLVLMVAGLAGYLATLDVDVIGIDWRVPLSAARSILGPEKAVQGNLDPAALFAPPDELIRRIDRVLEQAGPGPGHVFNLGHGIERTTDPDAVARLVDHVHSATARS